MKKPTEIYERFDVVKVPFPFIDKTSLKRRPALVLTSAAKFNSHIDASIMAMITSVKTSQFLNWPTDIEIEDIETAGLPCPSLIRMKLFTLDHRLVLGKLGILCQKDQEKVQKKLHFLFC